jgi:hypothetical protein
MIGNDHVRSGGGRREKDQPRWHLARRPTSPPLPSPPCGAVSPEGEACLSDSAAIVASEWPTGYSMAVWRCADHVSASVEAALRLSPDAVVTITPLAAIDDTLEDTGEPSPDSPPPDRPPLRLVH